jgi:hypothetical protein
MARCPNCGGEVVVDEVDVEVYGDVKIVTRLGRCRNCGLRVKLTLRTPMPRVKKYVAL